jgi:predicted transglutaminase-like cysteine proteinase
MGSRVARMGMTVWLAGCFCHAVCQSAATAATPQPTGTNLSIDEGFFHQVWQQRDVPKNTLVLFNGQPTDLKFPNVRDDVGLTDQEMQLLRDIAADCEAKIESVIHHLRLTGLGEERSTSPTAACQC